MARSSSPASSHDSLSPSTSGRGSSFEDESGAESASIHRRLGTSGEQPVTRDSDEQSLDEGPDSLAHQGAMFRECRSDEEEIKLITTVLGEGFRVRRAARNEPACLCLSREITVYTAALQFLHLPLPPFIREILNYYGVTVGQVAPNSWGMVTAFYAFLDELGIRANLRLF